MSRTCRSAWLLAIWACLVACTDGEQTVVKDEGATDEKAAEGVGGNAEQRDATGEAGTGEDGGEQHAPNTSQGGSGLGGKTASGGSGGLAGGGIGGASAIGGTETAGGAGTGGTSGSAGAGVGGDPCVGLPLWPDYAEVEDFVPDPVAIAPTEAAPLVLTEVTDLQSLEAPLRAAAQDELNQKALVAWQTLRARYGFSYLCDPPQGGTTDPPSGDTSDPAEEDGSEPADTERSGTNNQVPGVDEPDLMKLDDRYVYLITTGGELLILDAAEPTHTTEASRRALEGTPRSILVVGDRLLVLASAATTVTPAPCTYQYDCKMQGDGYGTILLVFDITDRTHPIPLRRLELSSSFLGARLIDGRVRLVTTGATIGSLLSPALEPVEDVSSASAALSNLEANYATEQRRLAEMKIELDPELVRESVWGDTEEWVEVTPRTTHTLRASGAPATGIVTITSFDLLEDTGALHEETIFSKPGPLYASANALFLAVPELDTYNPSYGADSTFVHQFDLSGASSKYLASGRVNGHVLSQFSMDQNGEYLRVATSQGWVPDPAVESMITVLQRSGNQLVERGKVEHIAPREDIRAVRFQGDRGYVVTFEKTDPLFVIDFSEPTVPVLKGELVIPGFSTYIHPLDDNHLLTIGYDADDQGDYSYFDGIQLQIMDVTDAKNPTLLFREIIGTRGSSSEALTNHLAFNYFAAKKMLAFPMTICEGGGDGTHA